MMVKNEQIPSVCKIEQELSPRGETETKGFLEFKYK